MKPRLSRPLAFILAFAAINLFWRLLFLPANQSAYTDGILQVDMFRQGVSFWPPLYALLTRLFSWIPGLGLEGGGRLVSLACGVLVLWPLAAIARRLFGLRAAFWAMAAWTVTPLALQWSLQVMTDMPFTLFWMATLAGALLALECCQPRLFPHAGAVPLPDPRKGSQWLIIAAICGALATLTRYQGILLLPPLALASWYLARVGRTLHGQRGLSPWLALLPWLAVPAWLLQDASSIVRHFQQIGARTGSGIGSTLVNYGMLFEEFLLKSPYFLTYGLFGFLLYGLFRTQWATARLRWTGWVALYLGLAVFALQAVFSSYQARYLLPLVPLACLFAGHGMATWERHNERHPLRLWGLILPTLAWGMAFSALVAVYQGSPFKDHKDAARYVARLQLPATARVFSDEVYNPSQDQFTIKAAFWCGRPVIPVGFESGRLVIPLDFEPPRPGDVIMISSYFHGVQKYRQLRELLRQRQAHELKRIARFALPLITDIMQEPGTAQNPLAWGLRYQWQYFETTVFQVQGTPPPPPSAPPPAARPALDKKIEELKAIRGELQKLKTLADDKATTIR